MRIGTAAWSLPLRLSERFPGEGQHLQRYARVLNCTEINSSFYRSHRIETYERWAALTPADFRFAVKLPRSVSHEARLTPWRCRPCWVRDITELQAPRLSHWLA